MIVDFRPEHLCLLKPQPSQAHANLSLEQGQWLATGYKAKTCLAKSRVVALGGLIEIWEQRAMAWLLLAEDLGQTMIPCLRAMAKELEGAPFRRVEMYIHPKSGEPSQRLAKMLGFGYESTAVSFTPDGADVEVWVKLRCSRQSLPISNPPPSARPPLWQAVMAPA